MSANIYNIVAYQAAWFACVLSAAAGLPWLGVTITVALIVLHIARTTRRGAEIELIAAAAFIGLLVDSALTSGGYLQFSSGTWAPGWAPYWMVVLWGAFATTLNHSLRWLTTRPLFAALFGAAGGPLAYWAGVKLGALDMPLPQRALPVIGAAWAAAMWLLAVCAAKLEAKGSAAAAALPPQSCT